MSTRIRAIITSSLAALLFFLLSSEVVNIDSLLNISGDNVRTLHNIAISLIIAGLVSLMSLWVLFFKSKAGSLFIFALFPGFAVLPYILLADSVITSLFSGLGRISLSIITAGLFWVLCYLLILTANVLNGSILFNIPLGQAGRAAQFIFSLVSSYFLIVFLFGGAFPVEWKVLVSVLFIFYYSFSCIFTLQVPSKEIWFSATAITLLMGFIVTLLSLWPISSVYSTVVAVVFLYIMLNVALEIREKMGREIWIEYGILIFLVVIILFTGGEWGINGRLI